jgi:uncharacterized protein
VGDLTQDLLAQGYELRETHISRVFLGPSEVFKVKKPVELGFLDFRTLDQRLRYCEAEVALNRRLAPSVYLGVVPIARDASGVHRIAAPGQAVEWAVHMRRLPDAHAADVRLARGRFGRQEVRLLARHIARFHAGARADSETARFGEAEAIERNVRENFAQTQHSALSYLSAGELAAIERFQLDFLTEKRALFEARARASRIRDGHGDLRLEHCYLDDEGGVEIIDCIEFNDRFRYGDVCADLAFLSMDLTWHERSDLSEALLAAYALETGDYDLYALVDFYESYRAFVRGKVSAILEGDMHASSAVRARAAAEARKYFVLAHACAREPLDPPALYAVGGLIASGKSSVARALGEQMNAPVIEADRTRKQLADVAPEQPLHDPAFAGHYSAEMTERTYAEVMRRAGVVLAARRPVVIDASFRARSERAAALELARRHGVPFRFIECTASAELCKQRLSERARGPSVSDGRLEIFDAFAASFEPVDELPPESHLRLDTARPLSEVLLPLLGI